MIKISFIGHLGRDAFVNQTSGKNVINFPAAHTDKFKTSAGVETTKTTWIDCAYWTDKTTIAQYLKKGTQVYLEGIPEARSWTDKTGKAGVSITVRVNMIQLWDRPRNSLPEGSNRYPHQLRPPSNHQSEPNSNLIHHFDLL
jgi:single-strand DNA-binding protein